MKPKIFTLICRERLVNSLLRNFHTGKQLLVPLFCSSQGLGGGAGPSHLLPTSSLVIQSQTMLVGQPLPLVSVKHSL